MEAPVVVNSKGDEVKAGTLVGVKKVNLVLVEYVDKNGTQYSQLAIAGDKTVRLLDNAVFGFGTTHTPVGGAREWLAKAILDELKKS